MRIIYNRTAGVLSEAARLRLQRIFLQDPAATSKTLHDIFPSQTVMAKNGRIQVTKKDGSIILDIFQDGSMETKWVESAVNLSMSTR
jgi:hypothetical protein